MLRGGLPLALALLAALAPRARGDVFELKEGGRVAGEVIERRDDGSFDVRTADGALVSLHIKDVQRQVLQNDAALEYQRRSRTAPDTAEAHRALAAWCREQGLSTEAEHHLRRVAELDPADEDARRSLGFQRVGNRWLSRDEVMSQRGLTFFDGKFRTAQDIALRERRSAVDSEETQWHVRLRLWRNWLRSNRADRREEAQQLIQSINDPRAAPALVKLLDGESDSWTFELLLGVLGRLDSPLAVQTLVAYSLNDDDAETRAQCLDYLTSGLRPVSLSPYVQALRSKDNVIINRAGEALGQLGDPAAVSPLIDALVTRHKYQVQTSSGGPGQMTAGFDSACGGGCLSVGGNGPQIIERDRENMKVLRALIKLSGGQNFDYDKQAWRHWYVSQQMRQHVNARRDQ